MGRGGEKLSTDGQRGMATTLRRDSWSFNSLKSLSDLKDDLSTLRHLWFSKAGSARSHAARLEAFYGPQAAACEQLSGPATPWPARQTTRTLIVARGPHGTLFLCTEPDGRLLARPRAAPAAPRDRARAARRVPKRVSPGHALSPAARRRPNQRNPSSPPDPIQTTSSAPTSCGAGARCWRRARRGCATAATWFGSTWAAAPG